MIRFVPTCSPLPLSEYEKKEGKKKVIFVVVVVVVDSDLCVVARFIISLQLNYTSVAVMHLRQHVNIMQSRQRGAKVW